jgi:hypothetical protein
MKRSPIRIEKLQQYPPKAVNDKLYLNPVRVPYARVTTL